MKNNKVFALALLLTASSSMFARIAIVDTQKLFGDLEKEAQELQQKLGAEFQVEMQGLAQKRQELEKKKADVKDTKDIDKQIADLESKGQSKAQAFQGRMTVKQQEIQKKAEMRKNKIEVSRKKHGWDVVIPKEATLSFNPDIDFTDTIIKDLGIGADKKESKKDVAKK